MSTFSEGRLEKNKEKDGREGKTVNSSFTQEFVASTMTTTTTTTTATILGQEAGNWDSNFGGTPVSLPESVSPGFVHGSVDGISGSSMPLYEVWKWIYCFIIINFLPYLFCSPFLSSLSGCLMIMKDY